MNIELWSLGKENNKLMEAAIAEYAKRINHYVNFSLLTLDNSKLPKSLPKLQLLEQEADRVIDRLKDRDLLVVLDEKGKSFTSKEFSEQLNTLMNRSPLRLVFLIGGSYGVADKIRAKASLVMGLSELTFPHQLVRLIFTEQLYRAFTILRNEKYHHE